MFKDPYAKSGKKESGLVAYMEKEQKKKGAKPMFQSWETTTRNAGKSLGKRR